MRILTIAISLLLIGCGTMEGDVNVEADSPSTEEERTMVEKNREDSQDNDTTEQMNDEPEFENLDYIQLGMTREMIVNIVGRPHEVKTTTNSIKWMWDEGTTEYDVCVDSSPWRNECWLKFDKITKRVISQNNMSPDYLDIYSEW